MYLFDTDFLINLAKGDEGALNFARKVEREMAFRAISVVTVHEYLLGTYFSYFKRKDKLNKMLRKAESDLMKFEIIPYTYRVAKKSSEIEAFLMKRGQVLGYNDIIIAATCLCYNLKLVTRNTKHFSRVPGLKIEVY